MQLMRQAARACRTDCNLIGKLVAAPASAVDAKQLELPPQTKRSPTNEGGRSPPQTKLAAPTVFEATQKPPVAAISFHDRAVTVLDVQEETLDEIHATRSMRRNVCLAVCMIGVLAIAAGVVSKYT